MIVLGFKVHSKIQQSKLNESYLNKVTESCREITEINYINIKKLIFPDSTIASSVTYTHPLLTI